MAEPVVNDHQQQTNILASPPNRGLAKKLLCYLREEGLYETAVRAVSTCITFIYSSRTIRVYARQCEPGTEYPATIAAIVQEIGEEQLTEIDALMYHATKDIRRRLKKGERCFVARVEGKIACYAWVVLGSTQAHAMTAEKSRTLRRDQIYIYNVRTIRQMRGKGLYPFLLTAICSHFAQEGMTEALIAVDSANIPSVRGIEKAGFHGIAMIRRRRILGITKSERVPLE